MITADQQVEWKFKNWLDGAAYSSLKFYSLESRSVKNEGPFMYEKNSGRALGVAGNQSILCDNWPVRSVKISENFSVFF